MKRLWILSLAVCVFVSACGAGEATQTEAAFTPVSSSGVTLPASVMPVVTQTIPVVPVTASPAVIRSVSTLVPPTSRASTLDPAKWKTWPILPTVHPSIRTIYEYGQTLGNDPHAFSIFGDCQTRPEEFFGVFETDPFALEILSPELRETVDNFRGSFNRESSTAQDGTTPGSLLWIQWHQGNYGCTFSETPVECELRTHRPSFVLIQVGTHFESRNTEYLRKIITQLLDAGVVPILATKADNREKDERINRDMALLASEYDLPLWNFWRAVSDLPNRGLYTRNDRPLQGDIYLTEEANLIHRMTGLEALNAVWRVATNNSR